MWLAISFVEVEGYVGFDVGAFDAVGQGHEFCGLFEGVDGEFVAGGVAG